MNGNTIGYADSSAVLGTITTVHLVLIVMFAVAVIVAIWWGVQLRRRRRAGERELAARQAQIDTQPTSPPTQAPVEGTVRHEETPEEHGRIVPGDVPPGAETRPLTPPVGEPVPLASPAPTSAEFVQPRAADALPPASPAPAPQEPAEPRAPEVTPTLVPIVPEDRTVRDDTAPDANRLADEPIAAAAPLDATPATLAVDLGAPASGTEPDASAPEPKPAAESGYRIDQIKGLGPKVKTRLAELGITEVSDLASLSDADAAALDAQLGPFAGRMGRDRWREQARLLAAGDRAGFEQAFGKL